MVVSRDLGVGRVFSTTFAPDQEVGFRLAVAGSKGAVQIWDTSTNAAVRAAFASKVPDIKGDGKERLVGLEEQDTDSDTEEGESDDTLVCSSMRELAFFFFRAHALRLHCLFDHGGGDQHDYVSRKTVHCTQGRRWSMVHGPCLCVSYVIDQCLSMGACSVCSTFGYE
jgi:WD40 repeat protein